jgi:hypothetical protein
MHGFNEYVDLESLRKSTKAMALFIAGWRRHRKGGPGGASPRPLPQGSLPDLPGPSMLLGLSHQQ